MTTRWSQRSNRSRFREPQWRISAHCHSSPSVTKAMHHAGPASFTTKGPGSRSLMLCDATSVSRTT